MALRMLFVCGASTGGAFRSTLELADALRRRGHRAEVLVEAGGTSRPAKRAERLRDAEVRLGSGPLAAPLEAVRHRIGVRFHAVSEPSPHIVSAVPENSVPTVAENLDPDAVIVSSIRRPAWRQIRDWGRRHQVLAVLYMRGISELDQLDHPDGSPDLLLSNTRSVADTARDRGHEVTFIPSLVDVSRTSTRTTREVALLVSPTEIQGVEVALGLAAARPDVPFVLQESWPLEAGAASRLAERIAGLDNVELRANTADGASIFRDARILLTPHRVDNRPRVVLEAQANGIPVIASDLPGLVDQLGDGGVAVDVDAGIEAWARAFSDVWDDDDEYRNLTDRARRWAERAEQTEESIVTRFESTIEEAIERPTR